jgi:glycosyltransferase involved in cell wall biosynthesis
LSMACRPVQVALHHQRHFEKAVAQERREFQPDIAVVVLSRLGDVLGALGDVPVVLDLVDALSLNMAQRGQRDRFLGRFWRWEAQRIGRWDRRLLRQVDLATVVSERDRRVLVGADETLGGRVRVVPFGLETERRDPMATARRPVVVLTGNLGYFPTVDGVRWFARRVWPRVRQAVPEAEWWLAGARPHASIRRLANGRDIRLFANPSDLKSIRRQAAVAVAPLRAGSGTPIKILEAMADGVPVVTTVGGRSGLDDLPQDAILTANTGENFARGVVRLLQEPALAFRTTVVAERWLLSRHDLIKVGDLFEHLLWTVVQGRKDVVPGA